MNTVKSFFHKHLKVVIPVFFLLYLIIGACAPFFYYQSLSPEAERQIRETQYYQSTPGPERVMP